MRLRVVVIRLAACGTLALVATSITPATATTGESWPQFGHDAQIDGFNPQETTLGASNVASLHIIGTFRPPAHMGFSCGGDEVGEAVVSNGTVYGIGPSAINTSNGTTRWQQVAWSCPAGAAVIGNTVYAAGGVDPATTGVYAFTTASGLPRWSSSWFSQSFGPPTYYRNVLYWTATQLVTLSAKTGVLMKGSSTPGFGSLLNGPAAIAVDSQGNASVVYATAASGNTGTIYAYNPKTMALLWSASPGDGIIGSPAVSGTDVFFADDSHLYAYTEAGASRWSAAISGFPYRVIPASAYGRVYVPTTSGVYAFDLLTGAVDWVADSPTSYQRDGNQLDQLAVANGVVYGIDASHHLKAINAATGSVLASVPLTGSYPIASVAVDQGALWINSLSGVMELKP